MKKLTAYFENRYCYETQILPKYCGANGGVCKPNEDCIYKDGAYVCAPGCPDDLYAICNNRDRWQCAYDKGLNFWCDFIPYKLVKVGILSTKITF